MKSNRVYNFGAGPAMLPEPLLKKAQAELLDWHNLGMSVLEVGHRTEVFIQLLTKAESLLRQLLNIPQNYQVLFLGSPARTQFSMIPMNLLRPKQEAGYLVTGLWSELAFQEAKLLKNAYYIAQSPTPYNTVPEPSDFCVKNDSAYFYYTPNETVNGIKVHFLPKTNGIPLVADMTSCLLTEPLDVSQYGLIFAGAQKNIANAGLTLVIIRDDLLHDDGVSSVPTIMNYKVHINAKSLYATPPAFNCYLAGLMFEWIKEQGGVDALYKQNCIKAAKLYQYLDSTHFYQTSVAPEARSITNICFSLSDTSLEDLFFKQAEQNGLCALKGHRLVGGARASLYNAMPMAGVEALIQFMDYFATEHR